MSETIELNRIRATNGKLPLIVATTNWEKGKTELFRNEYLDDAIGHAAILPSTAIPGIFPPAEIRQVKYVDGGERRGPSARSATLGELEEATAALAG